jgi:DNA-binding transcriptional LysR family regulator
MGLLYVPELYVGSDLEHGRLTLALREFTSDIEWGLYAVYSGRRAPEKVRAFIEFVRARIDSVENREQTTPLVRQQTT